MTERVVSRLLELNPELRLFVIGGDHSVSWPVVSALAAATSEPWAIVHPDAHTDLLPERLGVKYCFATWAYHANERLGRGGRLVQVGVRASGRARDHWESTLGVQAVLGRRDRGARRRRGDRVGHRAPALDRRRAASMSRTTSTRPIRRWRRRRARPRAADSGVAFVRALIARVGDAFPLLGGDVVEVAPSIGSRGRREAHDEGRGVLYA